MALPLRSPRHTSGDPARRPRDRMARSESLSRSVETRRIARLAAFPSTPRLRMIGPADNADSAGPRSPGARRVGQPDGGMHTSALAAGTWGSARDGRYRPGVLSPRCERARQPPTTPTPCPRFETPSWVSVRSYWTWTCLLYTSDAADDLLCVDLG